MKIKKIILLLSVILFLSCKNQEKMENEITKIYIATGLCYGNCPVQTVEIDSSLTVKYHGIEYAENKGYYIGKIMPQIWDSINSKFEKIKFKELDSVYEHSVDDPPVFLKIYYKNQIKKIRAQSASLPEEVEKTYHWLIEVAVTAELKRTNDSLKFDRENLKFMYPPPPPPRK